MLNAPKEIVGYIFEFLSVPELGKAAQVCKDWQKIVNQNKSKNSEKEKYAEYQLNSLITKIDSTKLTDKDLQESFKIIVTNLKEYVFDENISTQKKIKVFDAFIADIEKYLNGTQKKLSKFKSSAVLNLIIDNLNQLITIDINEYNLENPKKLIVFTQDLLKEFKSYLIKLSQLNKLEKELDKPGLPEIPVELPNTDSSEVSANPNCLSLTGQPNFWMNHNNKIRFFRAPVTFAGAMLGSYLYNNYIDSDDSYGALTIGIGSGLCMILQEFALHYLIKHLKSRSDQQKLSSIVPGPSDSIVEMEEGRLQKMRP